MLTREQAIQVLEKSEIIYSAAEVDAAVKRIAEEISQKLSGSDPLVLSVMGGAVVFTGHLLTLLDFPLHFDYVHVSRYGGSTYGGEINWKKPPMENVADRVVLVLDDILDEGHTMTAIRDKVMEQGAKAFYSAVFADKEIGRQKPIQADFIGVSVPNRYVFGFGMDIQGAWRNLPALYATQLNH